jgi:hypothetical protein
MWAGYVFILRYKYLIGLWSLLLNRETHECWSLGASYCVIPYTQDFSFKRLPTRDVHQVITDGEVSLL